MKLLIVVVAAICIVGVHSAPQFSGSHVGDAATDAFCIAANMLKKAGWMNDDGTWTQRFESSPEARECRNIVGVGPCDTADKVMDCLTNRGLATAGAVITAPIRVISPF